jgi:hypothetical protein
MFFSPLPPEDYTRCAHIKFTHDNGISPGSAFFVEKGNSTFLVTARHLIDKYHKRPQNRHKGQVTKSEVTAFGRSRESGEKSSIGFEVTPPNDFEFCTQDNDLAVSKFETNLKFDFDRYQFSDLADEQQLQAYSPGGPAYIVGYPEGRPNYLGFDIPFVRQGIFATPPGLSLDRDGQLGNDYSYIDSYALGGFSGCAVIAPQCGFPDTGGIKATPYYPRFVVGVLVRRVNTSEENAAGQHSGLSCFVRSISIRKLIEETERKCSE